MMDEVRFYAKLLRHRLPVMAALILICSIFGIVLAARLPTMYETEATLLVEGAQIPDSILRTPVQVDPVEQLEIMQRRLMTRANLLDVARENNVFPNIARMSADDVVQEMRSRTTIRRSSGRDRATVMTISFEGPDPRQVAAVVNQYVTIVLSTSSSLRTSRAQGTLNFFEQEVEQLSASLDLQSQQIVEFKNRNAGALPEGFEYRMNRLSMLQEQLRRAERDVEQLEQQRANIRQVFDETGNIRDDSAPQTPEQRQLRSLKSELQAALAIYSEENPKIRLLRNRIEALERQIAGQPETGEEAETSPAERTLSLSLAEIDSQIAALRQEIEDTRAEVASLEDSLSRTPANRIALDAMERELENLRTLHNAAVQRLNEARMGERVELSARGQRITLLEPPTVPNNPSSPNRVAVTGKGVIVGVGLAGAFFVLMELLNAAIRRPSDIVSRLQITPLATLPWLETASQRRWRRATQLATFVMVLVLVPAALWVVDAYYKPLDLLFAEFRDRLI